MAKKTPPAHFRECGAVLVLALAFLLTGPASFADQSVPGASFTVEGIITGSFFAANGAPIAETSSQDSFSFSSRSDGAWSLILYHHCQTNDFSYVTFDGKNEYSVSYNEFVRSASGYTGSRVPISQNVNAGSISEGGYPRYCDYNARIIWLALGSGRYLSQVKSNGNLAAIPLPWYNEQFDLRAYGSSLRAESFNRPPGLPSRIEFQRTMALDLDDAAELKRTGVARATSQAVSDFQRERLKERKENWKEGFVTGLYAVKETTNYGNMDIPIRFECAGFAPRWGKQPMCSFAGVVTNIHQMAPNLRFQPPILGQVAVSDARFHFLGRPAVYTLPAGGSWPSRGSPWLVSGLFLLFLSSIFIFAFRRRRGIRGR